MANELDVVQLAAGDLDYELTQTRRVLAAIPNGKFDYKPHPKAWSLGALANHVAQLPFLFGAVVRTTEFDFANAAKPKTCESVEELLSLFDQTAADARAALRELTPEILTQKWAFLYGGNVIFKDRPKPETLRSFAISHMIHHRAQLTIYLRELDAKVPGMYGPTADDA